MLAATVRRAVLAATVTAACAAPAAAAAAVTLPPANGRFDYQIGGAYTPAASVRIVDRDRTAAPVAGRYNVCYVNAFQTQSDEVAGWKSNRNNLLLKRNGSYVVDSAWNEILLDTSTAAKRAKLASIVGGWFAGCRARGYQAVEPDNLDSWTRSKGRLSKADNMAYASLLISRAHAAGLAIAQKNTTELGRSGKAMGFDFAIAEECQVYSECGQYTGPYGKRVYEIEYTDNGGLANFNAACAARGASIAVNYRDRDVVARGRPGYVDKAC